MKKSVVLFLLFPFLFIPILNGQESSFRPEMVKKALFFDETIPLRNMVVIQPEVKGTIPEEIPNKMDRRSFGHPAPMPFLYAEDPVWQRQNGVQQRSAKAPIKNFDGITNLSGVYPPDTQGDVSTDYYIQVVNMNFAVWNKAGTLLYGPAQLKTIWTGIPSPWNGTNNGDPVVLFDQAANRWIISQFSLPSGNYAELVAVSKTANPLDGWYRYVFPFGTKMPDYPKFGVWPDGYYMSVNQFLSGSSWGGVGACAMERDKMLAGDSTAQIIYFDLGVSGDPSCMLPSDWDGTITPVSGEPNYFVYFNDWSSPTEDYLKVWQMQVDWTTPANSTFSEACSLVTAPFNSTLCSAYRGRCINQPVTTVKLEALADRLMYRLQYRNFGGYRSMVTNHTVNSDGLGHAGIRWYELRNSGSGWSIHQQGTFAPDTNHRWMGSIAMNANGDMALGYSVSNRATIYPSIRYTGRLAGDSLGQMTFAEETIMTGTGYQSGSSARWGDYSMMSVDPQDDSTFWFTTEYVQTSGSTSWKTRIASFKFDSVAPTANFSASTLTPCIDEVIALTDHSFGNPTSWQWSITPATFFYTDGTSSSTRNPHVKFTKTGTYTIALTAYNPIGNNTSTRTNYITVNQANAGFTASHTTVSQGNSTVFTDQSTCSAVAWSWDFGSGATPATASTQGPHTVTYSTTGQKTVSLTVNGTSVLTRTNYINVIAPPYNISNATVAACSGNFYDPGGPSANYSDYQDFIMTFLPATPNSDIQVIFSSFSLESATNCIYDYLKIYNGNSLAAPLLGTWCGTTSPGTITASGSDGSLTFVFHADGGVTAAGWAATISCVARTIPPVASFSESTVSPTLADVVSFTDGSANAPTSWSWSFTPNSVNYVNGSNSSSQNPEVQFLANGIYSVSLSATNTYGNDVETKSSYIYAGTPGLWTGVASADWNDPSNWHNFTVPSSSTIVTIPSSAPRWPTLLDDLETGGTCRNVLISDGSEMTCDGALMLNPGDSVIFSGTGTLKITGDFTDLGILNSGTGNIEFTGSTPSTITGGNDKTVYVANYIRMLPVKAMTAITGGNPGPAGDDAVSDVPLGFSFTYAGNTFSSARISTNGWLSLNQTGTAGSSDNADLFTSENPGTVLTPWWDDLNADGTGTVSYKTEGSAPNRIFTTEWNRVLTFYSAGTTSRISFQVKLFETTNEIEFCYGTAEAGTHDLSEGASIGIKDATGGSGHFKEGVTGSVTQGNTGLNSASNWPATNYRFFPPEPKTTFHNLIQNKNNAILTIEPDIIVGGNFIIKE